jgi:hypothetical protein
VEQGGNSAAYPQARFLTGFAQANGKQDALESAKQQASGDLARQISVQIESNVVDVTRETQGRLENDLTSQIRATSDIRLDGIRFETHRDREQVWVLAILERGPAAEARRRHRDQALVRTKRCIEDAEKEERAGRATEALTIYRGCRTPLAEAVEDEAVATAISRRALLEDDASKTLALYAAQIDERVNAIPHEDTRSIRSAAGALAAQLARGGVGRGQNLQVAPFSYESRDVSSPFGREVSIALESAIGSTAPRPDPIAVRSSIAAMPEAVVVRGTYREEKDLVKLRANAKEAGTGRLLASAEISLARQGIPKDLETRPANFASFVRDADKLSGGDVISGDLRLELRTNKGDRGLVFDEGEDLTLYVRVNRPAWIRLIYVLTNGELVPIDQAWYIDDSMVNQLVEYPASFEVVPPFGVEMVHAMAYTDKPPTMMTRPTRIEGQDYQVVADGTDQVVRQRGIARKEKKQVAEQTIQLTTMRGPTR